MAEIYALIKLLENRHWEVRRASANAFSEVAAHRKPKLASLAVFHEALKPGIPQTIKLLGDSKVSGPAANAFCKLATHPVFHEALMGVIGKSDSSANAFGKLAAEPVFHETMKLGIPQIIKPLGNWMVRQSAAETFRKLAAYPVFHEDMKPGIPHIIKLLYSRDLEVRQSTANVFGELAVHRVFHHAMMPGIPWMMELLADSSMIAISVSRSAVADFEKLSEHQSVIKIAQTPFNPSSILLRPNPTQQGLYDELHARVAISVVLRHRTCESWPEAGSEILII
ncbi:hypothetical protein B0H13DRAFT_2352467 [Mycena leptocephala]|nr:hypothetical protein B0H13DRAFT_2352467 [Mycena leptocephala]